MTRETKLGLAVGTSFVSLLAVVAYHAWNKPTEPPTPPEPQVAAVKPAQPLAASVPGVATPGIVAASVVSIDTMRP